MQKGLPVLLGLREVDLGDGAVVLERSEVGEVGDVVGVGHEGDPDDFSGIGSRQVDHPLGLGDFQLLVGSAGRHD